MLMAGLKVGDRVLEVNGTDATHLAVDAVGGIVQCVAMRLLTSGKHHR